MVYVEIEITALQIGTRVTLEIGGQFLNLTCDEVRFQGEDDNPVFLLRVGQNERELSAHQYIIQSFGGNAWKFRDNSSPITIGVLVDMIRGCFTFCVTGVDGFCNGPCVAFPRASAWRDGVLVGVDYLPSAAAPNFGPDVYVCVTCSSPPVPHSLLAAAAVPATIAELLAAGALVPSPV